MKLDDVILDRIIEEELQRMLTEIRDEDLEFARQRSAQAQAQHAAVYGQKGAAADPETTATTGAGEEMAAARKSRQPKKKSWWKRFTSAPDISAEEAAKKKTTSQKWAGTLDRREAETGMSQDVNRRLTDVAPFIPIVGGAMTAADAWTDPKASPQEKVARTAVAAGQEFNPATWARRAGEMGDYIRGGKIAHDIGTGGLDAYETQSGEDFMDKITKKGFRGLPGAWKDPQKHAQQQAQAKAAQDPTARSAARDGLTAAQLDTRSQQRLALRKKGLQPYEIAHLEKAGPKRVDRFLASGANAVDVASDLRKAETAADRQARKTARDPAAERRAVAAMGSPDSQQAASYDDALTAHKQAGSGPYAADRASDRKKSRQRQFAVREGVKSTMLNENQIKRFQALANCESPPKRLITEAMDPLSIIGLVILTIVGHEARTRTNALGRSTFYGTSEEEELLRPWDTPVSSTIRATESVLQSVWKKLTGIAKAKTEEGDSNLESLLQTLTSSGAKGAARLSFSQLNKIQEEFTDDEELAALLSQLGSARTKSNEQYGEILSQVEQHIRSKLGI